MIDWVTVRGEDEGITGMRSDHALAQASSDVLTDLINALLAEELLSEDGNGRAAAVSELPPPLRGAYLANDAGSPKKLVFHREVRGREDYSLLIPVEAAFHQTYFFRGGDRVIQAKSGKNGNVTLRSLDLEALLEVLAECWNESLAAKYDYTHFFEQIRLSASHKALSLQAQTSNGGRPPVFPAPLLELEQWSALRDRPFHPAAKAKEGWDDKEYVRYSAEYGGTFPLQWIALRRDVMLSGDGAEGQEPADFLLSAEERGRLKAAFERLGLSRDNYAALPVHPWQMERLLPRELERELEAGVYVPLGIASGEYAATSSARSLAPPGGGQHVKVPLGIVSLGAIRSLPALYMTNGDRGQRLLHRLRAVDETLSGRLFLCDETAWWAYLPIAGDWFDDRPRHLSCQIRRYPGHLLSNQTIQLVPMSAFSVYEAGAEGHLFDSWMELRGMQRGAKSVLQLFGELCGEYLNLCMRMLRFGVLPEVHGQNVLLVLDQGKPAGLLLRDHDTVRLHIPWLTRYGIADPEYIVKPDRPNSLYNETPEQLLFYLQTLGIQVSLYAIAESLARCYRMEEDSLWQVMRGSLEHAVSCAGWPDEDRKTVEELLFEKETWPWKQIVTPLLKQQGGPGGSMPSGSGLAPNPFIKLSNRGLTVK
ncbi:IucA/IucC family protein [Paenibacillus prosopidis]|uniref:Siderophore synthetase component n=1 Tax=Paenibacillus prosopidis TaxID=630520 RepID=A0A368VS35_9BACL|nr:IucA/IucC family protein [Paenibacillus prosopidis]RCW42253.1 siderophore synthetase component [Paenibacillus prosopidis]